MNSPLNRKYFSVLDCYSYMAYTYHINCMFMNLSSFPIIEEAKLSFWPTQNSKNISLPRKMAFPPSTTTSHLPSFASRPSKVPSSLWLEVPCQHHRYSKMDNKFQSWKSPYAISQNCNRKASGSWKEKSSLKGEKKGCSSLASILVMQFVWTYRWQQICRWSILENNARGRSLGVISWSRSLFPLVCSCLCTRDMKQASAFTLILISRTSRIISHTAERSNFRQTNTKLEMYLDLLNQTMLTAVLAIPYARSL